MAYSNCAAQQQNMCNIIKTSIHFKTINAQKTKLIYSYKLLSGFIHM